MGLHVHLRLLEQKQVVANKQINKNIKTFHLCSHYVAIYVSLCTKFHSLNGNIIFWLFICGHLIESFCKKKTHFETFIIFIQMKTVQIKKI